MAPPKQLASQLRVAALLQGPTRDRVLRAIASLLVERELEEERLAKAREMAKQTRRRR